MRLTSAFLALAAVLTACNPDGDSGFANQVTAYPNTTSDGPPPGDDSSSGDAPLPTTTGDDESTTTGDETTAPLTSDADTTTGESTTGLPDATTSGTTTGDESTTTGEPVNPCPKIHIVVAPDEVANVRPTPATTMEPVGTLPPGALADVIAIVQGEAVEGNPEWYQIHTPGLDGYVWGGLVMCTMDQADMDGFFLPLACGNKVKISQGNNDGFSHTGQSAWAFDFSVGLQTPLVAIADGTVSHVYGGTKPGDPCYDGGGQECANAANYVNLLHGDGTRSIYAHLSEPVVSVGQLVTRGATVGKSGSTGWSTGPHAHVARTENCNSPWCQSIPLSFTDVPGDGVPKTGDLVTSMNCP
jgi:hypothetical protein